ncbi:MAG: hypothetical protein OFPII_40040 [Osedax symbiont Rs1]|nr:MAG: hypothetical protein OFPII_40040 [Osedax symbiont Rs1]
MNIDNQLWLFANQYYRYPGVAQQLLALQNNHDLSVNLHIYVVWLVSIERKIVTLPSANCNVSAWQSEVTAPLRKIRQLVKQQKTANSSLEATLTLCYQQLLDAELAAEKFELGLLYHQHSEHSQGNAAGGNLQQLLDYNLEFYWRNNLPVAELSAVGKAAQESFKKIALKFLSDKT